MRALEDMNVYYSRYFFCLLLTVALFSACQKRVEPVPATTDPPEPFMETVEMHLKQRNYQELRRLALQRLRDPEKEHDHDEALYLLVLVHSSPESPYFNPRQADQFNGQLQQGHSDSPYIMQAGLLYDLSRQTEERRQLLREVKSLSQNLKGSNIELQLTIRTLKRRIEALESEKSLLEDHLTVRQQQVDSLSEELAAARARSRDLAEELELLKEIDLKQSNRP